MHAFLVYGQLPEIIKKVCKIWVLQNKKDYCALFLAKAEQNPRLWPTPWNEEKTRLSNLMKEKLSSIGNMDVLLSHL